MKQEIKNNLIEFIEVDNNLQVINHTKNLSMTVINSTIPTTEFELETIMLICEHSLEIY